MQEHKIYPMSKMDSDDTRVELSCVSADIVAKYYSSLYGSKALEELLYDARINLPHISNQANWMSYNCFCRLLNHLIERTNNPMAPYEAWRHMADSKSLGPISLLAIRLGTVRGVYKFAVAGTKRWNRVAGWTTLYLGYNRFKLRVENFKYPQDKNNCTSIKGVLAAVPQFFGLPPAEVKELQCACDGADACIYDVSWKDNPTYLLSLVGTAIGSLVLLLYCLVKGFTSLPFGVMALFPVTGFMMGRLIAYNRKLKRVYIQNEEQAESLQESMKHIESLNEDLNEKVRARTEDLHVANKNLEKAMTELKESQEVALKIERQAGVGMLAGGMAHELNNPINAIRLSLQTFLEGASDDLKNKKLLQNAESATGRCKRIVADLLSFARKDGKIARSDLGHLLKKCVELFEKENESDVAIQLSVEQDLPEIMVDEEQMQQVIRNLISNAVDAMGGKGEINITLSREGDDLVIRHKDDGPGITSENRAKIFDTFFSTKFDGTSRGLGLSICADLVGRNGGDIDVVSEEGEGAEFVIRFPMKKQQNNE